MTRLRARLKTLLERDAGCGSTSPAATRREAPQIESAPWTFATAEGVEPTNNDVGWALRQAAG